MNTSNGAYRSCCFLGHREILETEELKKQLYRIIENLIIDKKTDTFLFGSKSRFNSLCYEIVSRLKEKHPYIKRIYVRAEFPVIGEDYENYLRMYYESTYYPASILGAGRAVYIERNKEMIDQSAVCIFYCRDAYAPKGRKSGTKLAFEYAVKNNKTVHNLGASPKAKKGYLV